MSDRKISNTAFSYFIGICIVCGLIALILGTLIISDKINISWWIPVLIIVGGAIPLMVVSNLYELDSKMD